MRNISAPQRSQRTFSSPAPVWQAPADAIGRAGRFAGNFASGEGLTGSGIGRDYTVRGQARPSPGWKAVAELSDHAHVAEIRRRGMILAIEMIQEKRARTPYPWQERRGLKVYTYALQHEVLLRPLGYVIYFMPPYVIRPEEIDRLARVAIDGINLATKD